MKQKIYIDQKYLLVLLVILSVIIIGASLCLSAFNRSKITQISDLTVRAIDDGIKLEWTAPMWYWDSYLELTVQSDEKVQTIKLNSGTSTYVFRDGEHGQRCTFSLKMISSGELVGETLTDSTLFLDMDQLPEMPLIRIETVNGQLPTASYVQAPPGCIGMSITDNSYVTAQMSLEQNAITNVQCTAQIRLRGNTSAYLEKKPYKIKLDKNIDLLSRGEAIFADKEWYLIPANVQLKFETGTKVAQLCGIEWQPSFMTVNLMINGKWQGIYYLTESIKVSENRVNISSTGFLIERDPYWWKDKLNSFQTPLLLPLFAYAYRFPTTEDRSDEVSKLIYDYMVAYESALLEGVGDLTDYIDVDSFAGWLLAHDILGTFDGAGSNMYLYKYDLDAYNITSSKLKMGPMWDFDSIFTNMGFASIHQQDIISADSLFQNPEFNETYKKKWTLLSSVIFEEVTSHLCAYVDSYDMNLQESWNLDSAVWQRDTVSVEGALDFVGTWLESKIVWLDDNIPAL